MRFTKYPAKQTSEPCLVTLHLNPTPVTSNSVILTLELIEDDFDNLPSFDMTPDGNCLISLQALKKRTRRGGHKLQFDRADLVLAIKVLEIEAAAAANA
jgi:hypothetical protein